MTESDFNPDWASPPGDTIEYILEQKGVSMSEFCSMIDRSEGFAASLLKGDERIDLPLAEKLVRIVGSTTGFWMRRDAQYVVQRAKLSR